jgi:hypothetical protein
MTRDGGPPLQGVSRRDLGLETNRTLNSRELGEMIHNRFCCVDVVVDERFAFLGPSFT